MHGIGKHILQHIRAQINLKLQKQIIGMHQNLIKKNFFKSKIKFIT